MVEQIRIKAVSIKIFSEPGLFGHLVCRYLQDLDGTLTKLLECVLVAHRGTPFWVVGVAIVARIGAAVVPNRGFYSPMASPPSTGSTAPVM